MTNRVLVVGATGMLGEPVARRLLDEGWAVRVLSRDPVKARDRLGAGFEIVSGNIDDPNSLEAAVDACSVVHINLSGGPDYSVETRGAAVLSAISAGAGVQRLGYISGASVVKENCWFEGTRAKYEAEAAIRASGVGYTFFKATWFMESLPKFVRGNRALVFGKQPRRWHWLAAADYARMVATAYKTPAAHNREFFLYGPEELTMEEALSRYCSILRPDAKVTHVPFWLATVGAALGRQAALRAVLPFLRYCEKVSEAGAPEEANRLLGAPTVTLEQWCKSQQ
jgi:uncharacterized protein YbjT (DUF2867 family)